jgi:hypothetical protein
MQKGVDMIQLHSLDVLVTINNRLDLYSSFKHWMMGPYDHVGMYLGKMGIGPEPEAFHAVFESVGRGILIRDLKTWGGRPVVVMELGAEDKIEFQRAILARAIKLASDYGSYYDYPAIIRWAIPRIILQKLHIPVPQTWKRDERHICSEAVYSVLEGSGCDILPDTQIPLPEDFVTSSPRLFERGRGTVGYQTASTDAIVFEDRPGLYTIN